MKGVPVSIIELLSKDSLDAMSLHNQTSSSYYPFDLRPTQRNLKEIFSKYSSLKNIP
jgi:hypothetical protein